MINGMITVRSSSTRLPNKCHLPFGEHSVIDHIITRAKHFDINPIICTTKEPEDDSLEEIAAKHDVRFYRGPVEDKLVRWRNTCRKHDIDRFVSIDADDLFFDGVLSHESLSKLGDSFDLIKHPKIQPFCGFYEGCVGYSLTAEIIERACEIKTDDDTEMMWRFIQEVDGVRITHLELAEAQPKENPIRLTLDYQEDYWLMCTLLRILGPYGSRKEISDLFSANKDLHKVNWFRNDEYLLNIQKNRK